MNGQWSWPRVKGVTFLWKERIEPEIMGQDPVVVVHYPYGKKEQNDESVGVVRGEGVDRTEVTGHGSDV